jgi:hypothetical protein
MSFNIHTVAGTTPASPPAAPVSRPTATGPAPTGGSDAAVHVDMVPSSPPPEVHDAIAVAAQSYKQLQAVNRELSFRVDDRTGKLTVEVHDLKGNLLFTVPASKALDVAAGGTLE